MSSLREIAIAVTRLVEEREKEEARHGGGVMPRELRVALKTLKLSQSEAARRLGVRQSTMYRWLAGERKIPGPVAAAVKCWKRVLDLDPTMET